MGGHPRLGRMNRVGVSIVLVLALVAAIVATPAQAEGNCGQRVLLDWSDNGRIDTVYELHCYDDAVAAMPSDLRDYTDASEVITRALAAVARGGGDSGDGSAAGVAPAIDTSGASSVPIALLALGGLALLMVALGTLAFVLRRLRGRRDAITSS